MMVLNIINAIDKAEQKKEFIETSIRPAQCTVQWKRMHSMNFILGRHMRHLRLIYFSHEIETFSYPCLYMKADKVLEF